MRNPSAYVPNFLNSQICCILSKFKNFIFAKIFDFKFSHRRESTRRGGVANFTGAAAFGVHPCKPGKVTVACFDGDAFAHRIFHNIK